MSKMVNLRKKLDEVQEETHRVAVKITGMITYPKYDEHFSSAKLDDWTREHAKLKTREEEIRGEIAALQIDPGFVAEQDKKLITLSGKRNALVEKLSKTKSEYDAKRNGEADAILAGADPLELSITIHELKESANRLEEAISIVNSGVRSVEALSALQFSRATVNLVDTPVD